MNSVDRSTFQYPSHISPLEHPCSCVQYNHLGLKPSQRSAEHVNPMDRYLPQRKYPNLSSLRPLLPTLAPPSDVLPLFTRTKISVLTVTRPLATSGSGCALTVRSADWLKTESLPILLGESSFAAAVAVTPVRRPLFFSPALWLEWELDRK